MSGQDAGRDPILVLVAAIGENNVIGRGNALPWRIPSDLKHFKAVTLGRPIVMGRKTYASIGRLLPGRTNIIVTRDPAFQVPGAVVAHNLEAALEAARAGAHACGVNEIMVIGGSDIFTATLPLARRLEITHVHAAPEGDVFFPSINPKVWRETSRTEHAAAAEDSASFATTVYERR
jgi:dihydrofolate reductase